MMTSKEQKAAAEQFAEIWSQRPGDEDQETQQFWTQLLRDVYGVKRPESFISFEKKVKSSDGKSTKKIDAYLAETRVLIEQKSRSKDLGKAQGSGYGDMTPYDQAHRYNDLLGMKEKAHWIVTCNFSEFRIHDMSKDTEPERREPVAIIPLADLPKRYADLSFFVDCSVNEIAREQEEISAKATLEVAKLYNALLLEYEEPNSPETLKHLNRLCVRLVFCYYAEDAGVFAPNQFTRYLGDYKADPDEVRENLLKAFGVMDTPPEHRDKYMKRKLMDFPYVNGGLFAHAVETEVPRFNAEIVNLLIKAGEELDWSMISPTIFGAMFESTLNPETRRSGGMHYTSIENIHKVIEPLFLHDLREEFRHILKSSYTARGRRQALDDFQRKLAGLTFLDPACGSGNFLTETYLCLRELENEVIAEQFFLEADEQVMALDVIRVNISQFYGIEINDFAVAVAKTALWIAEAQMLEKTRRIVYGLKGEVLPLKAYDNIIEANALQLDWEMVVPKEQLSYIIGNPPFLGARVMSAEQKADLVGVWGNLRNVGNLDFVSAWYKKTVDLMQGTPIQAALVSTNSITQGEQVAIMWPPLMKDGLQIDFAFRTFRWDNEARNTAAVHCVIIGFSVSSPRKPKLIFDGDTCRRCLQINPYLSDAPSLFIDSRQHPLCAVPEIGIGNKPIDGGNYLFTETEKEAFLRQEPAAAPFFHRWIGAEELINGKVRYCLYLGDCPPHVLHQMPHALERVENVRKLRLASKSAPTRRLAATPTLFHVTNIPKSSYLAMPKVSSERRNYIPLDIFEPSVLGSDLIFIVPNATLFHFSILTSSVHMAWMRAVGGRLKSDYRYSKDLVYNNFPWPEADEAQQSRISALGKAVLEARAAAQGCTLADLYDPRLMPPELSRAHQALDKAVLKLYGLRTNATEVDILAELFRRYRELTQG